MDLSTLSSADVLSIKEFAYAHDLRISEVIELLKLEQERIKTEQLSEIASELSMLNTFLSDKRNNLNSKNVLESVESSIYSVTTAIEKLDNKY